MRPSKRSSVVLVLAILLAGPTFAEVTTSGGYSISIDADFNLEGAIFKEGDPFLHNDGGSTGKNTALGRGALENSTPGHPDAQSGRYNTAIGSTALKNNTVGRDNTAVGRQGLLYNDGGGHNTAVGARALMYNTQSDFNTAVGSQALYYTGDYPALYSQGDHNIALGYAAGFYNKTGTDNIFIGSRGVSPSEDHTLRIGDATGAVGHHKLDQAFIAGIANRGIGTPNHYVCVNTSTDQLGACGASSLRFKEDIATFTGASEGLSRLRVVKFRYKEEIAKEAERRDQYGLIAEEVEKVFPHLVTYDAEGLPMTVRYAALTPLLLRELQRQQGLFAVQQAELEEVQARLARLEGQR